MDQKSKILNSIDNFIKHVKLDDDIKKIYKEELYKFHEPTSNVNLRHREKKEIGGDKNPFRYALVSRTLSLC